MRDRGNIAVVTRGEVVTTALSWKSGSSRGSNAVNAVYAVTMAVVVTCLKVWSEPNIVVVKMAV